MNPVLVPLDFSDVTPRVIDMAGSLAQACGAAVVLVHVHPPEPPYVAYEAAPADKPFHPELDLDPERRELRRWQEHLLAQGLEVDVLHLQGPPAEQILNAAADRHAGMIVMGSHGHGAVFDLLVGSITHGVLHRARCPVTVVPAGDRPTRVRATMPLG